MSEIKLFDDEQYERAAEHYRKTILTTEQPEVTKPGGHLALAFKAGADWATLKAQQQAGSLSDGYHTFDELYDHRCILWIAWMLSDGCPGDEYWVREHYEGWDLLVCNTKNYGQISYHVMKKFRHLYENIIPEKALENHVYDGHTSKDVYERIFKWCEP